MSIDVISLAKTASFIVDNRGKTVPTMDKGIPLIKTNCITNDSLYPKIDGRFFVSKETYEKWFRAHPIPGDLILTLKGSQNGAVALVPDPVNFVIAQDMVAIRIDSKIINPHYLFAVLRSREVQHQIKTLDVSGVIPHLKKTDFDKLIFQYPKRETQDYIGKLYFTLSSKIENLQAQNKTLETTAQTIFKEWFGKYQVGDELPKGWRVGVYSDLVKLSSGKGVKKSEYIENGKYDIIGANGPIGKLNKSLISEKVILTGRVGTLGTVFILNNPAWVSDNVLINKPIIENSFYFTYFLLKGFNFSSLNTGSTQPLITQGDLKSVNIIIPEALILKKYYIISHQLFLKVLNNTAQIQTLKQTRDTLLPKLMSGALRVEGFKE